MRWPIVPRKSIIVELALGSLLAGGFAFSTTMLAQDSPKFAFRNRLLVTAPNPAQVAKGLTILLHEAHVSSNGTADVTRRAIWVSADPGVATVSNLPGTQGIVTGVSPGNVTITAVSGLERGSLDITVTGPAIVAITVTPANDSIPLPGEDIYTAKAFYSDNSAPADVTTQVNWSATPNVTMSLNTATGVSPGIATITAHDSSSGVFGRTSLNVGLGSISVSPANPAIPLGENQRFYRHGRLQ